MIQSASTIALTAAVLLAHFVATNVRADSLDHGFALVTPAIAKPAAKPASRTKEKPEAALKKKQAAAVATHDKALAAFKKVLAERRAQIDGGKKLPRRPGQAIYLARLKVMSTYKEMTDILPARIGRPNKYGVPPAYFDADIEPLIEEYAALFRVMQAPPTFAQASATPLRDVIDLGRAIARAKGADTQAATAAGRIGLALFFAETGGNQNMGNARSTTYKGSLQTGPAEDRNGRRKWAAIKAKVAALDPALSARDDAEEARSAKIDQRYNHWTAVRNGLMNAHAELFGDLASIIKLLPDEIDQMRLFELIQIVPTPTRAAIRSGNIAGYKVSDARVMGFLRNNSIFTFGDADRARTSATYREIMDAMWLFTPKFEKARAKFNAVENGALE
ncbi:MAG: hypothetical protein ACT4N2_10285 [Hyphomicrobium sp.]